MIINPDWSEAEYKRKRARFEEIHEKNQQVLRDLKAGTLKQSKHKGIYTSDV